MVIVNRERKIAVVLLTNTATAEVDKLAQDLIRMLAGASVQPREFEKTVKVDPAVMQKYVGKYELAPTFIFTVSVDEGKLMVQLTNQPAVPVFPRSETEWFYKAVKASITFKLDDQGACVSLELHQNGVRQTAKRIGSP